MWAFQRQELRIIAAFRAFPHTVHVGMAHSCFLFHECSLDIQMNISNELNCTNGLMSKPSLSVLERRTSILKKDFIKLLKILKILCFFSL